MGIFIGSMVVGIVLLVLITYICGGHKTQCRIVENEDGLFRIQIRQNVYCEWSNAEIDHYNILHAHSKLWAKSLPPFENEESAISVLTKHYDALDAEATRKDISALKRKKANSIKRIVYTSTQPEIETSEQKEFKEYQRLKREGEFDYILNINYADDIAR